MKHYHVFTLVPEAFGWFAEQHPMSDALERGRAGLHVHNIRSYTPLSHLSVDDTPYGGGPGMVIRADVMAAALEAVFGVAAEEAKQERDVYLLSPGGRPFDDVFASEIACSPRETVLLCGRYEGFDERVSTLFCTGELSVGPYVLAGGEVAALAVLEASVRKVPGVLGNEESLLEESFSAGLEGAVEYPHYTRPREFRGVAVPDILLGGNHAAIARWRRDHARPGLWRQWASGPVAEAGDEQC
jgi:tRNA (guanine37-N1)-methyltransferase